MFGTIVIGVDGREGGRAAVGMARQLLDRRGGRLVLVNVYPLALGHAGTERLVREHAQQLLERERARVGIHADTLAIADLSVGRGLHAAAENANADLLAVGSSSRGAIGRVLLGDDVRATLHNAPCSVAIAAAGPAVDAPEPAAEEAGALA